MGSRKKASLPTAQLDSLIAKMEGKKVQVGMGNIREVRKIIDNLIINNKKVRARYALFFKVS